MAGREIEEKKLLLVFLSHFVVCLLTFIYFADRKKGIWSKKREFKEKRNLKKKGNLKKERGFKGKKNVKRKIDEYLNYFSIHNELEGKMMFISKQIN